MTSFNNVLTVAVFARLASCVVVGRLVQAVVLGALVCESLRHLGIVLLHLGQAICEPIALSQVRFLESL
jgi:hypothetical protein